MCVCVCLFVCLFVCVCVRARARAGIINMSGCKKIYNLSELSVTDFPPFEHQGKKNDS